MNATRQFLSACTLAIGLAGTCSAQPADYPAKPVMAIVAFPPGAPNDFIVRLIGESFQQAMRQPLCRGLNGLGLNLAGHRHGQLCRR